MATRSKVTIADVAQAAGVSTATAGRVLGSYGYAAKSTRDQVTAVARKLGYRPNGLARSLITGETRTIGVVAGDIRTQFYASILRGISDVADEHGFGLLITNSDERLDHEMRALDLLMEKQVDGLIVSPCDTRKARHLHRISETQLPIVLIDRAVEGLAVDQVTALNAEGAEAAVGELIRAGHTRIGVVAELLEPEPGGIERFIEDAHAGLVRTAKSMYPSWQRLLGYINAHRAAGLAIDSSLIRPAGSYSSEAAHREARDLLSHAERPSALFTTDGTMSEGVMRAIAEAGLVIPRDVSLVGFDDLDWMAFTPPGISAISQPRYAMGAAAARMLLDRVAGSTAPTSGLTMTPEFIKRGSIARR
ncbi:LacI family DNA-binding transcriptional regulator [Pararhizobium mangrovi]|uniref:LacI family transcriptional regulator n=1 Tax=Pararhizobium mangrovi TaxID=2590452 RepID=A0A506U3H4_9HYPH|nr:LacI family DNA-binding transcriptional regulator [Pararhizobium mangrovi]TPW28943.1 LacI family transcriptional regulator [Pararhizobium mangrovi]